ncbi:MAG TPA: NAD(P)/FAD-dependent oxidoreductase [Terriglobales bacterium]|nr:NAD(P)/FAD-dependent oxidoreductase [Terriglobales bacterium]
MENAEVEYDLIVAGAGPAGCACAITAARAGARVLLLEKDTFPRHKVCGEFVSPESLELLQSLLRPTSAELAAFSSLSSRLTIGAARIFLDGKSITIRVSPPARSVPRFDLDAALLNSARSHGASVREQTTVCEVQNRGRYFHVVTAAQTFTGKTVVNASGRWSHLSQPKTDSGARWIGFKAHFREAGPPPSVDLYFFPGGYCGVTPVNDGPDAAVNACAMVRADVCRSLPEVFAQHPELWRRSRDWEPLFPAISTSGLIFREPETRDRELLLAGDAAGFIDPFAGDGISLALHSGTLAGECMCAFLERKWSLEQALIQYGDRYRGRFSRAFKNAAHLRRLLETPAWIRSRLLGLAGTSLVAGLIVRGTRAKART